MANEAKAQLNGNDALGWLLDVVRDRSAEGRLADWAPCPKAVACAHAQLLTERTALKARDGSAAAKFLAHPRAGGVYDCMRYWVASVRDGENRAGGRTEYRGDTREDACAAALRALEPERGGHG